MKRYEKDSIVAEAEYHAGLLPQYCGNPLTEALPEIYRLDMTQLQHELDQYPSYPLICSRNQDAQWLIDLSSNLFISTGRHCELLQLIDIVIRHGYLNRCPLTCEQMKAWLKSRNIEPPETRSDEQGKHLLKHYKEDYEFGLSICVVGCSGVGKSRSVSHALSLYPQVIRHSKLFREDLMLQIVYLKVECPDTGSIRTFCTRVLDKINELVRFGNSVGYQKMPTPRLQAYMIRLLAFYNVGMLVIDEVQNLEQSRADKEILFNFFTSLSNSLGVPMLFIGTPKSLKFLTSDARTARRFGSCGLLQWDRYRRDSAFAEQGWKKFSTKLNDRCRAHNIKELSQEALDTLYDRSQGITDCVIKLFVLSQMRAMVLGQTEITPKLIKKTFDDYFGNMKRILSALRENQTEVLATYKDVCMSQEEFVSIQNQLACELYKQPEPETTLDIKRKSIIEILTRRHEMTPSLQLIIDSVLSAKKPDKIDVYDTIEKIEVAIAAIASIKELPEPEEHPELKEQPEIKEQPVLNVDASFNADKLSRQEG